MFHGDKRTYQSWKAAFLACIDNAPATPEYKLLQLRQYVSGEALQTIESLGHSATAYELCYRCLSIRHYRNKCPQSRPWGSNGCKELHHRLLHQNAMTLTSSGLEQTELKRIELTDHTTQEIVSPLAEVATSVTEGKRQEHLQQITLIMQNYSKVDYIALRTVPIILKNGDRSLQVNALLDEASTKIYVNSDVAAEQGLKGKTEKGNC